MGTARAVARRRRPPRRRAGASPGRARSAAVVAPRDRAPRRGGRVGGEQAAGLLGEVDEAGAGLQLAAGFGIPADARPGAQRLELGQAFCGTVAATLRPLVADAARIATDAAGAFVHAMGVHAYACHPLLSRDGRLLGTFSLASTTRHDFEPADVEFLQTLCNFMALAWERMRADRERRHSDER